MYRQKLKLKKVDIFLQIFMFLINPPSGSAKTQKLIAKHVFKCFEKRKGEHSKK